MGPNSSIFSSETYRRSLTPPGRQRAWHALIVASVITCCWFICKVQVRVFRPVSWQVPDAEVLFIGSSHVDNGVVPSDHVRPTGLLWFQALSTSMARAAFDKHRALWPHLEVALIEVDEWTLLTDVIKFTEGDLSPFAGRLQLNAWELPVGEHPADHFSSVWGSLAHGQGLTCLDERMRFTTGQVLLRCFGYASIFPSGEPPKKTVKKFDFNDGLARSRVSYLESLSCASPEINLKAIADLARSIRAVGARVVLITLPMHEIYNRARPPAWDEIIAQSVDRVSTALGYAVPYWNFRHDPRFRETAVYKNQDHLNPMGARRFAVILQDRIEALLVEENPSSTKRGRE